MNHDSWCREAQHYDLHEEDWSYWCLDNPNCAIIECNCQDIAEIRKDEREKSEPPSLVAGWRSWKELQELEGPLVVVVEP